MIGLFLDFEVVEPQEDFMVELYDINSHEKLVIIFFPYSMIILCTKPACLQLT
jgi:peroxiredoxin